MKNNTPINKWFFIYQKNILESTKIEHVGGNKINLLLIHKGGILMSESVFKRSNLFDSRIEGWQTPDLIWEDKQYGYWDKVFVETYTGLKSVDYETNFDNNWGKVHRLTVQYESCKTLTRYDADWNENQEWKEVSDKEVRLPVKYSPTDRSKPLQSYLMPNDLYNLYESVK